MSRTFGISGRIEKLVGCGLLFAALLAHAEGLPEPPLLWYGIVRNNAGGQNVRLTSGELIWTVRPDGVAAAIRLTNQLANINDQFSYIVEVPCESEVGGLIASPGALRFIDPAQGYLRGTITLDGQALFLATSALESFTLDRSTRGQVERLDLAIMRVDADSDGDGLPDWWESQFPGGDVTPGGDYDGDGVSNADEYRAGTDPTDPSSFFYIVIDADENGVPVISWNSALGKTYRLFRSETLSQNIADFIEIRRGIGATLPANELYDWGAAGPGPYFYLLQVEE